MIKVRTPSGTKQVTALAVHGHGAIKQAFIRTASGLSEVFSVLNVSVAPSQVSGSGNSRGSITISTSAATAIVQGGSGTLVYTWTSPDAGWAAVSPASSATSFRRSGVGPGNSYSTTFTCTVTDGTGASASTTVGATVMNTNAS